MKASILRYLPAGVSALALIGCGVGFNEMTGGDGGRGDARELAMETMQYDRVDAERGDHTDWKKFVLEEDAKVLITVWWMSPDTVKGSVELRDQRGELIKAIKHASDDRKEAVGPVKLSEGTYFIQFSATSGGSDYGFEVKTEGSGSSGPIID